MEIDIKQRKKELSDLGIFKPDGYNDLLLSVLTNKSEPLELREEAALYVSGEKGIEALAVVSADRTAPTTLRYQALVSLTTFTCLKNEVLDKIVSILLDPAEAVLIRCGAARVLHRTNHLEAIQALTRVSANTFEPVLLRAQTLLSLGKFNDPEVRSVVKEAWAFALNQYLLLSGAIGPEIAAHLTGTCVRIQR